MNERLTELKKNCNDTQVSVKGGKVAIGKIYC